MKKKQGGGAEDPISFAIARKHLGRENPTELSEDDRTMVRNVADQILSRFDTPESLGAEYFRLTSSTSPDEGAPVLRMGEAATLAMQRLEENERATARNYTLGTIKGIFEDYQKAVAKGKEDSFSGLMLRAVAEQAKFLLRP